MSTNIGSVAVFRIGHASAGIALVRRWSLRLGITLGITLVPPAAGGQAVTIEFHNGRWYTGTSFEQRTMYVRDGRFASTHPGTVDRRIDLEGRYVIPPFGDAHNHAPDGWPGSDRRIAQFIEDGVFYILNPNSFPSMTRTIAALVNVPTGVDVLFSNGGLTPPGSHVTELYDRNLRRGVFPAGWTLERLDREGYFIVRDRSDLEHQWPAVLAGKPDFIKVFLAFSEEYESRRDDSAFVGKRGIDPDLVPIIAVQAHAAGLRVAAHIETAHDFRVAIDAGVDIVAHMPASWRIGRAAGYADSTIDRWLLREADARAAAGGGAAVVAHVFNGFGSPLMARIHAHNLALLKRHGVRLAIGSDNIRQSSVREAIYLQRSGLFTSAEILNLASVVTPAVIFPGRKIGRLEDGFEASFLVVEGDPIAQPLFATSSPEIATQADVNRSLQEVRSRIRLRVKQGHVFTLAPTAR